MAGIGRKLESILQGLKLLAEQGNVGGFINNPKNADNLSGLVGDICDAVMDYQVCSQSELILLIPDTHFRLCYNKTSIKKVVSLLWVSPLPHPLSINVTGG